MNSKPSEKEIDFVRESLVQFNNNCVGEDGHTPLDLVEYDADGNLITAEYFEGKTIDVQGIVDYYNGTYQIKGMTLNDFNIHE